MASGGTQTALFGLSWLPYTGQTRSELYSIPFSDSFMAKVAEFTFHTLR